MDTPDPSPRRRRRPARPRRRTILKLGVLVPPWVWIRLTLRRE